MKIAVVFREHDPLSLIRYRNSVMQELQYLGVTFTPIGETAPIPDQCDLVWEPGISGNRVPARQLWDSPKPVVLTIHGAAPFTVKWNEYFRSPFEALRIYRANRAALKEWPWFRNKISAVIVVSKFGANEVSLVYDLPPGIITHIYHGVDPAFFFLRKGPEQTEPFFLHVSAYQPVKNLKRLINAYNQLPISTRPKLIIVAPGFKNAPKITGLRVIDRQLTSNELAYLYRNALGFIFPSLRESFGLPIIEAMACGCPVITSFDTACAEVAGEAALLVNPRATDEIAHAMSRIIDEPDLRAQLSQKGLTRANQFTWAKSARAHLSIFRSRLNMGIEIDQKPIATTCIVVLGMHRSGTSALAGVLSLLGIHPGGNLLPAVDDVNPKGFWEHAEIVSIHEQLLSALDSSWYDESTLPGEWWLSPIAMNFRNRIVDVLRRDFGNLPIWLVKDPRMCRLLPLWQQVFLELNCQPSYVLVIRDPSEVAQSLRKRDELTEESSCLQWLTHVLEAEYQTRGQTRVFASYERLLADWRGTVADISKALNLTWPVALEDAAPKIDAFLDPSLRHYARDNTLPDHPACRLAQRCFRFISADPRGSVKLDRFRTQTGKLIHLVIPTSKRLRHRERYIHSLESRTRHLEEQNNQFISENNALQAEIRRLKATYSWQVTKPLRLLANLPRLLKVAFHK